MGSYLVLGAVSISEAADYVGEPELLQTWEFTADGVLFRDPTRSDAQCAALYVGYIPSGLTDFTYVKPLPSRWKPHLPHLRTYRDDVRAGLVTPTALNYLIRLTETQEVLADLIDLMAHYHSEIDSG